MLRSVGSLPNGAARAPLSEEAHVTTHYSGGWSQLDLPKTLVYDTNEVESNLAPNVRTGGTFDRTRDISDVGRVNLARGAQNLGERGSGPQGVHLWTCPFL